MIKDVDANFCEYMHLIIEILSWRNTIIAIINTVKSVMDVTTTASSVTIG